MAFGWSAATWAMIGAVAGTGVSAYSADQSNSNAKKSLAQQQSAQNDARIAAAKQEQQAIAAEKAASEAENAQNMKMPDTGAMLAGASQAGRGGASSTMLTGSQGVDPNKLKLGKSNLLGS